MNPEIQLVAKILESGDFKSYVDSGTKPEDTLDVDCRRYLLWIKEYYTDPRHPRAVPTPEIFAEEFPDAILPNTERTTVKELVVICRERRAKMVAQEIAQDILLRASEDPAEAFAFAATEAIKEIGKLSESASVSFSDIAESLIEEYHRAKEGEFSGVPWPWTRLNELTKGIENGNFVVVYGRAKQMKTWLALYIVTEFYRRYPDARVLVYSLEMTVKQMAQRSAAIMARVPYGGSLLGSLSALDEERFLTVLEEIKIEEESNQTNGKRKGLFIVAPSADGASVLDLRNKIELYSPDLVLVDGVYYMAGSIESKRLDWREIAKVSRDLKASALEYNIPVIGVSQANRDEDESGTMKDIGFTDNLVRDVDIIIKTFRQETQNLGTTLAVVFKGVREFNFPGMLIHAKPAVDFEFIKEFDNVEQIKEFLTKNKKAIATMRSNEDPSRSLGHSTFAQAMLGFGGKGAKPS